MTITTDTFTGSNGDPAPSPWVAFTPSGSQNIQSNKWRMNSGGGYDGTAMTRGATTYTDVDLTVEVTLDPTGYEQYPGIGARLSGGTNGWAGYCEPHDGYIAYINTLADAIHLDTFDNGLATPAGSAASFSVTAGTTYKLRFQLVGTTIRCKGWDASGSEPGTWLISRTDTAYSSGLIGFRDSTPSNLAIVTWDNFVTDDAPGGGGGTLGSATADFVFSSAATGTKTVLGSGLATHVFASAATGTVIPGAGSTAGGGAAVVAARAGR